MADASGDTQLLLHFDRSFNPPEDCGDGRCDDVFPEFIYIVVVPLSVVVLIVYIFLIYLLLCCIFQRRKAPVAESEDQLATYEAIRYASTSVRRMSHGASTPLLEDRTGSLVRNDQRRRGFRPRDSCHSAPGTLQRHHRNRESSSLQNIPPPPPPYGTPPAYFLADDDDAFLGPGIPLQEFPADDREEPRENDHDQHPNHHRRHHRRQRPYSAANGYMTR